MANPSPSPKSSFMFVTPTTSPRKLDRKSTRLNSSHQIISYAVFCLKKKKNQPDRGDPIQDMSFTSRRVWRHHGPRRSGAPPQQLQPSAISHAGHLTA